MWFLNILDQLFIEFIIFCESLTVEKHYVMLTVL